MFAKENCELCQKAQDVLARIGVETDVRYVEGAKATPENIADFAWHDWVDKMPLVVALDEDQVVAKWNGDAIKLGFTPEVRRVLGTSTAGS